MIPLLNTPSASHYFQSRGFPEPDVVCLVGNSEGISLQFPLKPIFFFFFFFGSSVSFGKEFLVPVV